MSKSVDMKQLQSQSAAIKEHLSLVKELTGARLQPVLQRQRQELKSFRDEIDSSFKNVFSGIEKDLSRGLDFRTMLGNTLQRSLQQVQGVISQTISQTVQQAVAGGGGAGGLFGTLGKTLGGFFGGARAVGGPVMPGQAFLVGERGPELFVPHTAGRVAPSGGGGVNIVMNITTPDAGSFRHSQGQIVAEAAQVMQRAKRNL